MKESIDNAFLFNLIIFFIIIFFGVFTASLVYSKGYKFKNRIVQILEKNQTSTLTERLDEVNRLMADFGYRRDTRSASQKCSTITSNTHDVTLYTVTNYRACIYWMRNKTTNDIHYKVTVYGYLDLPLVGGLIQIPVSGETKTFRNIPVI